MNASRQACRKVLAAAAIWSCCWSWGAGVKIHLFLRCLGFLGLTLGSSSLLSWVTGRSFWGWLIGTSSFCLAGVSSDGGRVSAGMVGRLLGTSTDWGAWPASSACGRSTLTSRWVFKVLTGSWAGRGKAGVGLLGGCCL